MSTIGAAPVRARAEALGGSGTAGPAALARQLCWKRELTLFAALFACFPLVAWIEPGDPVAAVGRVERLVALQRSLGLDVEQTLHQWLAARPVLLTLAKVLYFGLHVSALVGVLVWLAATRPNSYRRVRNLFVTAHVLTIAIYLTWPTAPPRYLGDADVGHDMVADLAGALQYDYAALPSGHVVFALVVAAGVRAAPSFVWRAVGYAYPVVVTVLVLATGHHLLFDVVVAAIVVAAAAGMVRRDNPQVEPTTLVPVQR